MTKKKNILKNKKIIIGISILILLVIFGVVIFPSNKSNSNNSSSAETSSNAPKITNNEHFIEIKDAGFFPQELNIKKSDKVTFTNNKTWGSSWPTLDKYQRHEQCGTPSESTIFDACKGIKKGESYSFTFNEIGSFNYYDSLETFRKGTIIVT